jgi:hypothetical protein
VRCFEFKRRCDEVRPVAAGTRSTTIRFQDTALIGLPQKESVMQQQQNQKPGQGQQGGTEEERRRQQQEQQEQERKRQQQQGDMPGQGGRKNEDQEKPGGQN